jgi:O-antigen/teichoic acid export membrane protein
MILAIRSARTVSLARYARQSSLHRNSAWIMLTVVLTSALGYAYWLAAARLFPARQIGLANGLVSLMTITAIIANVGTAPALVHRLPTRRRVEDWSTTLSASLLGGALVGLLGGVLVLAILPVLSPQLSTARDDPVIGALFLAGTSACVCSTVLDYAFVAERQSRAMSVRGATFALVKIPLVVLPAIAFGTLHGTTWIFGSWVLAYIVACLAGIAIMVPRLRPGFRLRIRGAARELRDIGRLLAGNYFITLGNALPLYLLPVIVVTRLSATANAYFYITWMVGGIFFMISSAVGSSLFAEGSNDPARLTATTRASVRLTAVLLAPAILLVLAAGEQILGLFGPAYASNGTHLLWVLTLASIPDAITNLYVPVLRVRRRLRAAGMLTLGMAAITVVAAWIVAPGGGLSAIGVVWLIGQTLGSLWVAWDALGTRQRALVRARCGQGEPSPAELDAQIISSVGERRSWLSVDRNGSRG